MMLIDLLADVENLDVKKTEEEGYFYAVPAHLMGEIKARLRELARAKADRNGRLTA